MNGFFGKRRTGTRTNTGIDVEGEKTLDILHQDLLRYADNARVRTDLIRRTLRYFICVCAGRRITRHKSFAENRRHNVVRTLLKSHRILRREKKETDEG